MNHIEQSRRIVELKVHDLGRLSARILESLTRAVETPPARFDAGRKKSGLEQIKKNCSRIS